MPLTSPSLSRIALITGASSGIGRASAVALASAGWTVVLSGRRNEQLQETIDLIEDDSDKNKAIMVPSDLAKPSQVKMLFDVVRERYGRLDLLFNNAGIGSPKVPLEDVPLNSFQNLLAINIAAPFLCTQEAFKLMKSQNPQGGRIINNGSVSAYAPRPLSAPYTLSKHAISGLTKSTALDGRAYKIACSQLDIGNAQSVMSDKKEGGVLQADGSVRPEPVMDVKYAAQAVVYMASLPLHVNILNQTIMATAMPFVGRG